MSWLVDHKDIVWTIGSATTSLTTSLAAIVGIITLNKWRTEMKGRRRHDVACKIVEEVYNLRNVIAVARGSWRTVFFTGTEQDLLDREKIAALRQKTVSEHEYWLLHLKDIENGGLQLRNASVLGIPIWPRLESALEDFKQAISEWQFAVNERVDALSDFNVIPDCVNLNKISPILISERNYEKEELFDPTKIPQYKKDSASYWDGLDKAAKGVYNILEPVI